MSRRICASSAADSTLPHRARGIGEGEQHAVRIPGHATDDVRTDSVVFTDLFDVVLQATCNGVPQSHWRERGVV